MQGILYEESWFLPFLIVTVIMGGAAAWQAGRATAQTWRSALVMIPYGLLLGCAARFLHFAVFGGTLLSLHYFIVDTIVIGAAMVLGFRWQRSEQMSTQYSWLFDRRFPFGWGAKHKA
jgi:predicted small integral membrane protein